MAHDTCGTFSIHSSYCTTSVGIFNEQTIKNIKTLGFIYFCDTKWYNEAGNYVYKRKQRGLPLDMTLIPEKEKQYYRGLFIYYPIADLLSHMDGKKSLRDIIDEYDWIKGSVLPDEKIAEYIEICKVLCRYGYLEAVDRKGN